jgi:hypothetical protein
MGIQQSMVCGMSSSVVSTIDILERKNSSASNGSCTSIVNGRNPTHANTAVVHELRNHLSSDVCGRDSSHATSTCKNTRISRHTLKELEEKSKGTQFELLIERYHSLVHEAMQKKKEEAIRVRIQCFEDLFAGIVHKVSHYDIMNIHIINDVCRRKI